MFLERGINVSFQTIHHHVLFIVTIMIKFFGGVVPLLLRSSKIHLHWGKYCRMMEAHFPIAKI